MSKYKINTTCVQGGYEPGNGEPRQVPIYQSTTFKYATSEDMGKLFDLEADGYFYSRLQNPTNDYVAAKITAHPRYPLKCIRSPYKIAENTAAKIDSVVMMIAALFGAVLCCPMLCSTK